MDLELVDKIWMCDGVLTFIWRSVGNGVDMCGDKNGAILNRQT